MRKLKVFLITLISIIVGVTLITAATVAIFISPQKLTPIINNSIQSSVLTEAGIKHAEVTVISTFPYMGVRIDSISLRDTSSLEIAYIKELEVIINPVSYLLQKRVDIRTIRVTEPYFNVMIHSDSSCNIISALIFESPEVDTLATDSLFDIRSMVESASIGRIEITDGKVQYEDSLTNTKLSSDSINLKLRGKFSAKKSILSMNFSSSNINTILNGKKVMRDAMISTVTKFRYDNEAKRIDIDTARTTTKSLSFGTKGSIALDTINRGLICDLKYGIRTSSLKDLIRKIPRSILKEGKNVRAEGTVGVYGTIIGKYSADSLPAVTSTLRIKDGKVRFTSMDYGIQELSTKTTLYFNGFDSKDSRIEIESLNIKSDAGIELSVQSVVENIFGDYKAMVGIKSDINLSKVKKMLPMADGISMEGYNYSDLQASFDKKSIDSRNYGNIVLDGDSRFEDLLFTLGDTLSQDTINGLSLHLAIKEGNVVFDSEKVVEDQVFKNISTTMNFSQAGFKTATGTDVYIEDVELYAESGLRESEDELIPISASITLGGMRCNIPDTLSALLKSSKMSIDITPYEQEKSRPLISLQLVTDSLALETPMTDVGANLSKSIFKITATPIANKLKEFTYECIVAFRDFTIIDETNDTEIMTLTQSRLRYADKRIILNKTPVTVGNSDMQMTGSIQNAQALFTDQERRSEVIFKLEIDSEKIDVDDLMSRSESAMLSMASLYSVDSLAVEPVTADSIPTEIATATVLKIPRNLSSCLILNVGEIVTSTATVNNVKGLMTTERGVVRLDSLSFNTAGADMIVTGLYEPVSDSLANTYFDLAAKDIIIEELIGFMPAIDTLMPILGDIEGVVDFNMVARSDINRDMLLDIASLESVMRLDGKNIVLFDSETFATISKMLMFKNKDRNLIDELGLNVIIRKGGVINVPPFDMTMDRYNGLVGGTQTLNTETFDIDYSYNISILKSPLPFKAGVDITGTNEDFKYKITTAKLKNMDLDAMQLTIDSIKLSFMPKEMETRPSRRDNVNAEIRAMVKGDENINIDAMEREISNDAELKKRNRAQVREASEARGVQRERMNFTKDDEPSTHPDIEVDTETSRETEPSEEPSEEEPSGEEEPENNE